MYFYDPAERDPKELVPGINARTFWGENMLIAVVDLDPDTHMPRHSHHHEQLGNVIQGQMELTIGDEKRLVKPGDVYIIPSGVEHEAQTFDESVKVIDVFSPVREEYK
ncbi:MAG: cupin domain-containing protein [Anaerolineales bacterium]|nr:cupin domain-containing protein [Chloroflexota bacterium]MBL6980435.1 cupin domain-containing protein [Anaerolineales bacterium]